MNSRRSETLEILHCAPQCARAGMPPLLFLHGAYTAAWCWREHYLPFFAAAGFNAHALSFSGHAGSRRRDILDSYSINDYVDDVVEAVSGLPAKPVLIGHSMGGFVVQKYLEKYATPAAVLTCSVPPHGLAAPAFGMMLGRPSLFADLNQLMSGGQLALDSLRNALFAQPVPVDDLLRYYRMAQPESHRAIWDMMLFNLPRTDHVLGNLPDGRNSLLVTGAEHDAIIPASLVSMTARTYGTTATIYPGLGHGMMLEVEWRKPAQDIIDWLATRFA